MKMKFVLPLLSTYALGENADHITYDKQCQAQNKFDRIVNGVEVVPGSWPWMVVILQPSDYGTFYDRSFCGGSILSPGLQIGISTGKNLKFGVRKHLNCRFASLVQP